MVDGMVTIVDPATVARAVASVRRRIDEVAAGRHVELIAVTKGFGADAIAAAGAAGCTAIGENYAQELRHKIAVLGDVARPAVHFIGRLQTNKVRLIAPFIDVWQSVDRSSLVAEIAKQAPHATVFVQVNTTDEANKGGCLSGHTAALVDECASAGLVVQGLMTVGPTSGDEPSTSAAFEQLRALADRLGLSACSMGMSGDFERAILHGATHVRIGSALFGARPQPRTPIG